MTNTPVTYDYDFSDIFKVIPDKMYSEDLIKSDTFKNLLIHPKYAIFNDLPDGEYIKKGYFIITDVARYLEDKEVIFQIKCN